MHSPVLAVKYLASKFLVVMEIMTKHCWRWDNFGAGTIYSSVLLSFSTSVKRCQFKKASLASLVFYLCSSVPPFSVPHFPPVVNWPHIFKPPPPVGAGGGYMFSGCPSVRASVRPCVRPCVRPSVIHVVVLYFRDISSIC